jgi:hypothetical protein
LPSVEPVPGSIARQCRLERLLLGVEQGQDDPGSRTEWAEEGLWACGGDRCPKCDKRRRQRAPTPGGGHLRPAESPNFPSIGPCSARAGSSSLVVPDGVIGGRYRGSGSCCTQAVLYGATGGSGGNGRHGLIGDQDVQDRSSGGQNPNLVAKNSTQFPDGKKPARDSYTPSPISHSWVAPFRSLVTFLDRHLLRRSGKKMVP